MLRTGPQLLEGFSVLECPITLVLSEFILGINLVQSPKVRVPIHFGKNGCRGNAHRPSITVYEGVVGNSKVRQGHGIGEDEMGLVSESRQGLEHGVPRGLIYIQLVHLRGLDKHRAKSESSRTDLLRAAFSVAGRELFRVVQPGDFVFRIEDHCGSNQGP